MTSLRIYPLSSPFFPVKVEVKLDPENYGVIRIPNYEKDETMNKEEWLSRPPLTEMDTRTSGIFVTTDEGKVGVLFGHRIVGSDSCGVNVHFGEVSTWIDVEKLRRATEEEIDAQIAKVRSGEVDTSDIPELTAEQFEKATQVRYQPRNEMRENGPYAVYRDQVKKGLEGALFYVLSEKSPGSYQIERVKNAMRDLPLSLRDEVFGAVCARIDGYFADAMGKIGLETKAAELQEAGEDEELTIANPAGTEAPTPGLVITCRMPGYGDVEMFGHRRIVGELYDVWRWGETMGMVRKIDRDGKPIEGQDYYFSGKAIYCIRPINKEEAIEIARSLEPQTFGFFDEEPADEDEGYGEADKGTNDPDLLPEFD